MLDIPLGPKSGLEVAGVPGSTGSYDAWEGAGACVQVDVNPSAPKAAGGLIKVAASNDNSGTEENQVEGYPAARIATGDQLLVVSGSDFPTTSMNSQINHCSLHVFQGQNTIIPKLTENSKAKGTSLCEGDAQGTKCEKEEPALKQIHQTSVGHGDGENIWKVNLVDPKFLVCYT